MQQFSKRKPEIIVFAGPNGSGKSTISRMARIIDPYINADDIKATNHCTDLEAAQMAEQMRVDALNKNIGFTFETVLSTRRNLELLRKAKEAGYFIRCIYVLTSDVEINILRIESREAAGGHGVPEDKTRSRYRKALELVPELIEVADIVHIYDNTREPYRIFKKRKDKYFFWENDFWTLSDISNLTGIAKCY